MERASPTKHLLKLAEERGEAVIARKDGLYARSEIRSGEAFLYRLIAFPCGHESGEVYGELADFAETGANDIYCVKQPDGREVWIPAISDVIIHTDPAAGVMRIRPLKGLFDE